MKKLILLFVATCLGVSVMAQEETAKPAKQTRKRFFNISYNYEKIKLSDGSFGFGDISDEIGGIANDKNDGIKNKWGVSMTRGRSYMLHKKPIARLISIGLDASFFDLSYSKYKAAPGLLGATLKDSEETDGTDTIDETLLDEVDLHKMEYSFQVGPSITITPGKKLTVAAYFRYAPTFSCMYVDGSFGGNYASMFVTGASVTYNKFGVGIEARMGSCKYKNFSGDLDFSNNKIKTSGFRAFIQFRW